MREKGVSPPPKPDLGFEDLRKAKMPLFVKFIADMDKWLQRLSDVFPKVQTTEVTIDPGLVGANTTDEQTFTVVGLRQQDIVTVTKPTHTTGLGIVGARCSANDTLAITFINCTGVGINPGSETYLVSAIRR